MDDSKAIVIRLPSSADDDRLALVASLVQTCLYHGLQVYYLDDAAFSAEVSNPGSVGSDTGYTFMDRKGSIVRVIAKSGESRSHAIERVKSRHR